MFFPEAEEKENKNLHHQSKVKKFRREETLLQVSELYLKGWILADISKKIGISINTTSKLLGEVKKRWLVNQVNNFELRKSIELERIDKVEREYWEAWERSKRGQKKKISVRLNRTTMRGDSSEDTESEEFLDTPGDPRFLEGVQKCIAMRTRILGLEESTKIEHSGTINVNNYQMDNRDRLTDAQKMHGMMNFIESLKVQEIEAPYEPILADSEVVEANSISTIAGE